MPKSPITGTKRKALEDDDNVEVAMDDPAARMAEELHELGRQYKWEEDDYLISDGGVTTKSTRTICFKKSIDDDDDHLRKLGQYKGVNISLEVSDTFAFDSPEQMEDAIKGDIGPDDGTYIYSRSFNPTVQYLGRYIAAMEATESAYCTSSGMSAITAAIMHLCGKGGHVVAAETLYAGSTYLLKTFLHEKCNITTDFVDITNFKEVEAKMIPGKTKVLYFESVANPALVVANIPALSEIARKKGVQVVVDNTFTPMILTPAKLGANVVIHSLTKYVSGGADMIAGAICGTKKLIQEITDFKGSTLLMLGPVMNPKDAFDLVGRMAHTSLRVKKHCNRALKLAERMKKELNLNVVYPGLKDHPDHQLLNSMRNRGYGFGGVLCIDMDTTEKAYSLLRGLKKYKFGFLAVSLGYYETLMSCTGASSSKASKKLKTQRAHMSPGYVRLCVGYSGTLTQKWNQFKRAFLEIDVN